MSQIGIATEWLLEGFRYELGSTCRPATVEYYCGEVRRFLRWAIGVGIPSDIRLVTERNPETGARILRQAYATPGCEVLHVGARLPDDILGISR